MTDRETPGEPTPPLKACPFCGRKPLFIFPHSGNVAHHPATRDWVSVFCSECNASSNIYATQTEAKVAWNRRSPPVPSGQPTGHLNEPLTDQQVRWMEKFLATSDWDYRLAEAKPLIAKMFAAGWGRGAAPMPTLQEYQELFDRWQNLVTLHNAVHQTCLDQFEVITRLRAGASPPSEEPAQHPSVIAAFSAEEWHAMYERECAGTMSRLQEILSLRAEVARLRGEVVRPPREPQPGPWRIGETCEHGVLSLKGPDQKWIEMGDTRGVIFPMDEREAFAICEALNRVDGLGPAPQPPKGTE